MEVEMKNVAIATVALIQVICIGSQHVRASAHYTLSVQRVLRDVPKPRRVATDSTGLVYLLSTADHSIAVYDTALRMVRRVGRIDVHDSLFEHQDLLSRVDLLARADELDIRRNFNACLDSASEGAVQSDIEAGNLIGVRSTPTFFVGRVDGVGVVHAVRRIDGARSSRVFQRVVEELRRHVN
jgi:hypothetical protein